MAHTCEVVEKEKYSQPSLFAGSASEDAINCGKFQKKKFQKILKSKTWICLAPGNYLHIIYTVLSIISNLEMI